MPHVGDHISAVTTRVHAVTMAAHLLVMDRDSEDGVVVEVEAVEEVEGVDVEDTATRISPGKMMIKGIQMSRMTETRPQKTLPRNMVMTRINLFKSMLRFGAIWMYFTTTNNLSLSLCIHL